MTCKGCGEWKPIENKDTGLCASCNKDARNNYDLYPVVRKMYLDAMIRVGATCPVYPDIPIDEFSQIHHKKGRLGYASEEKRQKGITLLIDVEYFLAVSPGGHQWIEDGKNRQAAEERGFIISRLTHDDDVQD